MELTRTIRDKMMNEHLLFVYRGVVTSENSVPLLMLLEKEMENSEFGFVGRKRLFMFVLESLQNVSRHNRNNAHAHMSMVVYSKSGSGYTVTTGNALPNSGIADLRRRLEEINNLENREIRNVYRQMLSSAEFSEKGGAGLGLIEMAKKTGNKLDFDFVPLDDSNSYFVLSKTVDSGGHGTHHPDEFAFHGQAVMQLERIMADNNMYLIWSGHISPEIGKEVISFTETRLSEDDIAANLRKRVFSILVEILENVSRYSPGKEPEEKYGMPLAILRLDGKVYSLTTGNLILNEKVTHLKEKLDDINQYDKVGLKEAFRKSLSGQSIESDSTGNMGLLDMARKSGSKLDYEFEKIYQYAVNPDPRYRNWDIFFHNQPAAKAVRNRKQYFINTCRNLVNEKKNAKVLILGSGPATDVYEFLSASGRKDIKFDLVDLDQNAIDYSMKKNECFKDQITFNRINALRYTPFKFYDMIWTAGLFDYFKDKHFSYLIRKYYNCLTEDGRMIIGNFSTKNPSKNLMENIIEWVLNLRTESDLFRIAGDAGVDKELVSIDKEPLGINLFLVLRKNLMPLN